MRIGKPERYLVLAMLSLFIGSGVFIRRCGYKEPDAVVKVALKKAEPVATTNGTKVVQGQAEKATSAQLEQLTADVFRLTKENARLVKRNNSLTIALQKMELGDTITARYTETLNNDTTNCDSLKAFAVMTPAPFEYRSDSININGTVLKTGVRFERIFAADSLYSRNVSIAHGFLNLGRRNYEQVLHSNTMFRTDSMQVFVVDKTPSWWHRTGKPVVGACLGATLMYIIQELLKNFEL